MTVKISDHAEFRNIKANALKGVELKANSIFYGFNGAGKTSITKLLEQGKHLYDPDSIGDSDIRIFAFTPEWIASNVGEFVEGRDGTPITTVALDDEAGVISRQIEELETKLLSSRKEQTAKEAETKRLEKIEDELLQAVKSGDQAVLGERVDCLKGNRFNKNKVREYLNGAQKRRLSEDEISEKIDIVNSVNTGVRDLPVPPSLEGIDSTLKASVESSQEQLQLVSLDQWVVDGLEKHTAGDECLFCGNVVTERRLDELKRLRGKHREKAEIELNQRKKHVSSTLFNLNQFQGRLEDLACDLPEYRKDFETKQTRVLKVVGELCRLLEQWENQLDAIMRGDAVYELPETVNEPLVEWDEWKELSATVSKAKVAASKHSERVSQAEDDLRSHCAELVRSDWNNCAENKKKITRELRELKKVIEDDQTRLTKLRRDLSSTAQAAEYITEGLASVLGDKVFEVREDKKAGKYRIFRRDQSANEMSEGEKKLVSLLYFCYSLKQQDKIANLGHSVVIFDDPASELDELRQFAVDRFITDFFDELKAHERPKAICYFTHSREYLSVLIGRLGSNIKKGKAVAYEVYKTKKDGDEWSRTYCRAWEHAAINFESEYDLSFAQVVIALLSPEPPHIGAGNFARKVLEVFTEFRSPGSDRFGIRMSEMYKNAPEGIASGAWLSKWANDSSHSSIGKASDLWKYENLRMTVRQTLRFVAQFDPPHFDAMVEKVGYKDYLDEIRAKIGVPSPSS